jgi:hypothetical protein
MKKELYLQAPKVQRTHCYVQKPVNYEIFCPLCQGHNTEWSEFEKHIWCHDCKQDVLLPLLDAGIFNGPIPTSVAEMVGLSFDRINIDTLDITKFDPKDPGPFNDTWVRDEYLSKYMAKVNEILSNELKNN